MAYNAQAANEVFDYITGMIRSGTWVAGTKIATELQLCEQLGVSRIAVRQAIEKLSAISVLRKVQGSGTYVEDFENVSLMGLRYYPATKETMMTVLEFRRMFDSYNTELFITRCAPADIAALEENFEQMQQAQNDHVLFRVLDNNFHAIIAKGTNNPIIVQLSNVLVELLELHQSALYTHVGPEHAIEYHRMILGCIKGGNAELAGIYARMHIDNSLKTLAAKNEAEIVVNG